MSLPFKALPIQQFSFWRSTGIELWLELKPLDHDIHQVMPTVKDHRTRQGLDIIEKRLAPGKHATKQGILLIAPLQHRMGQKGEEVEAEPQRCQGLLAMPKVVLQMVALGFEDVVMLVCDLPAPAARLRNVHTMVSRQAMMGDKTVVLE